MVSLITRKIRGKKYYYLEQSFRNGKSVLKKTRYLGKKIPKNIEDIKKEFVLNIYKQKWFNNFDKIKKNYQKEQKTFSISTKEKFNENFAINFTYNSNRIEGSTLTLKETTALLEKGLSPSKKISDIKETEAHKEIFEQILKFKGDLSLLNILYWHNHLFKKTKIDIAGKIREHPVAIFGSKFVPPLAIEVPILLNDFFDWYNKNKHKLNPIELAALVHLKFVTIHPFSDGNGRISRLLMNFVLNKNNFPMMIIPYEKRNSYYNALERSQIKKDESIFVQWFFKRYLLEYKRYS